MLFFNFDPKKFYSIGAGSFGAPVRDRPESVPRLYNILVLRRDLGDVRVHTRSLARDGGAWGGWAVWRGDEPESYRSFYDVSLVD